MAGADWKLRFTAPEISFPAWSAADPSLLAYVGTESGAWQVWTLDLTSGERRQVTDHPVGVEQVLMSPDGRVIWWIDDSGDERGRWMTVGFEGGEPGPLFPTAPHGWATGISFADGVMAFGIATDDDYRAYVAEGDEPAHLLHTSERYLGIGRLDPPGTGGLSTDGRYVCLRHSDHGDILHEALRVHDHSGTVVAELEDVGSNLDPVLWSTTQEGAQLVFTSELGPYERPGLWDPAAGTRVDLEIDLPGATIPLDRWPDASALLVRHEFEGTDTLYRVDVRSGAAELVSDPGGEIAQAAVRPDGEVWLLTSNAEDPPGVVTSEGRRVLAPQGSPPPAGVRPRSFWFENPKGERIQAFVTLPPGDAPFPTVMSVHGGPEWYERDRYEAETQAFVDAGYAVAQPNYRGSTGYGIAFRRALIGDPWLPESQDVIACLDSLVAEGIADPDRVAFSGWSWGGCLACLNAGLHPDRWRAVVAGIPSGDFVAAHRACMPELQAYDVALYGGTPDELPEMWAERNPMTYADRVRAPTLIIAGEQDPRCPVEGITPWVEAVRARDVAVDVHLYPSGHHANTTEEQVRHMQLVLDFLEANLRPSTAPS